MSKEEEEAHEVPGVNSAEAVVEVDEDEPHAAHREDELPVSLERDLRPEQVHGYARRPPSPFSLRRRRARTLGRL